MARFFALFVLVAVLLVFGRETNCQAQSTPACPVNETWNSMLHGIIPDCRTGICVPVPQGGCQCISGYVTCSEIGGCVLPKDCPGTTQ